MRSMTCPRKLELRSRGVVVDGGELLSAEWRQGTLVVEYDRHACPACSAGPFGSAAELERHMKDNGEVAS